MGAMTNTKFRESIHSRNHTSLRNFLIDRRKSLGLSQKSLAERLGGPSSLVGKVETGDRRLDFFEMDRYCEALDTSLSTLLKWYEGTHQKPLPKFGSPHGAAEPRHRYLHESYTLIVTVVDDSGISETVSFARCDPKKGLSFKINTPENTVSLMVL